MEGGQRVWNAATIDFHTVRRDAERALIYSFARFLYAFFGKVVHLCGVCSVASARSSREGWWCERVRGLRK